MAEIINNVTFLYTKIQKPVLKYGSTTDSEWTVDCVISKAEAKKWKKTFPKNSSGFLEYGARNKDGIYRIWFNDELFKLEMSDSTCR